MNLKEELEKCRKGDKADQTSGMASKREEAVTVAGEVGSLWLYSLEKMGLESCMQWNDKIGNGDFFFPYFFY